MTISRKKFRWWLFDVIIPAILAAGLLMFIFDERERLRPIIEFSKLEVLFVAVLTLVTSYLNSLQFFILYRVVGARVDEHWALYIAGQAANHLPGQLGTAYRFRYLSRVHNLSYADAAVAYGLNFVISVGGTGVVGVIGCIGLGVQKGTWSIGLVIVLVALILVAGLAVVVPTVEYARSGPISAVWTRFRRAWNRGAASSVTVKRVLALEVIRYGFGALRLYIAFRWLGFDEPYFFFLIIAPIAGLATFVAITPAGLGVRELAIAAAVVSLGRPFESGLIGSSADRVVTTAVILLVGTPTFLYTNHKLRCANR